MIRLAGFGDVGIAQLDDVRAAARGAVRDPASTTAIARPDLTRNPTAVMSFHQVVDLVERDACEVYAP